MTTEDYEMMLLLVGMAVAFIVLIGCVLAMALKG